MKKLIYSKNKLNSKIIDHFETIGKFEYSESKYNDKEIKEQFEIEFQDTDINDNGKYDILVVYDFCGIDEIRVYCSSKNEEYKMILKTVNHNPTRKTLVEELTEIREKQDKTDNENILSARYIEETNEILNLKNR